jgi:hypothetical protein
MSHSVDERYDVYNERERRAAKEHACDACKETIRKGDVYCRIFIVFMGDIMAVVRCLRCQKIHEHLRGLDPGETWPDERLNCGEEYREHWGEDPPPEIAELAFLSQDDMQVREQARILARRKS